MHEQFLNNFCGVTSRNPSDRLYQITDKLDQNARWILKNFSGNTPDPKAPKQMMANK